MVVPANWVGSDGACHLSCARLVHPSAAVPRPLPTRACSWRVLLKLVVKRQFRLNARMKHFYIGGQGAAGACGHAAAACGARSLAAGPAMPQPPHPSCTTHAAVQQTAHRSPACLTLRPCPCCRCCCCRRVHVQPAWCRRPSWRSSSAPCLPPSAPRPRRAATPSPSWCCQPSSSREPARGCGAALRGAAWDAPAAGMALGRTGHSLRALVGCVGLPRQACHCSGLAALALVGTPPRIIMRAAACWPACSPSCRMNSAPQLAFAVMGKPTFYKQRDNQLFPSW